MNNTILNKFESLTFGIVSISILYVLIYNLLHYDPIQGYDGDAHHAYVQNFLNLYTPGRLNQPSSNLTYEFFSPPFPYLFPAFVNEICKSYFSFENIYETCQRIYGFVNIILQSLMYLLLLYIYMKIVKLFRGTDKKIYLSVLLVLGLFTANYRTIGMIRAETYILLLNSFLLYRFLLLLKKSFTYSKLDIVYFGFTIGLLALSRQWAFLLFPAYFLLYFFIKKEHKFKYFKFLTYTFFIGFLISSWFYINLYIEYGSFTKFNQEPIPFSLKNQPLSFYLPIGNEVSMVFTKPIRPYFQNQFLPILYSDLWGDYWGYFTFTSRNLEIGRNQLIIGDYLARVNMVSLIPTLLLFSGLRHSFKYIKNIDRSFKEYFNLYLSIAVFISLFGYLWFLISFPQPGGDTNKATYIIHLFHLLGLMAVFRLEDLKQKNYRSYFSIMLILFFVFLHNLSAMMSHFPRIV
tara:strand:- start:5999 stop:7381 length:1383 start_codon:yes stop_codon:yes gene_type:complete